MLLVDSGGQYDCGTTDITRTFHFGTPTAHQMAAYTRVLQVLPSHTLPACMAHRPVHNVSPHAWRTALYSAFITQRWEFVWTMHGASCGSMHPARWTHAAWPSIQGAVASTHWWIVPLYCISEKPCSVLCGSAEYPTQGAGAPAAEHRKGAG
jgi:Metallopeptidase family M24